MHACILLCSCACTIVQGSAILRRSSLLRMRVPQPPTLPLSDREITTLSRLLFALPECDSLCFRQFLLRQYLLYTMAVRRRSVGTISRPLVTHSTHLPTLPDFPGKSRKTHIHPGIPGIYKIYRIFKISNVPPQAAIVHVRSTLNHVLTRYYHEYLPAFYSKSASIWLHVD